MLSCWSLRTWCDGSSHGHVWHLQSPRLLPICSGQVWEAGCPHQQCWEESERKMGAHQSWCWHGPIQTQCLLCSQPHKVWIDYKNGLSMLWLCCRTVLPHMLENKSGSIAVTSSTAGKAGVPFSGTYTGSKHAIHGYFESLRTEKVGCTM